VTGPVIKTDFDTGPGELSCMATPRTLTALNQTAVGGRWAVGQAGGALSTGMGVAVGAREDAGIERETWGKHCCFDEAEGESRVRFRWGEAPADLVNISILL
jgi:hypothetical protein